MIQFSVQSSGKGFTVWRDDKVLQTPAGNIFELPTQKLAEAIASEWRAQSKPGKKPRFDMMPNTAYSYAAIDVVARERFTIEDALLDYAETDLLCYRAHDDTLNAKQEAMWNPLLQKIHVCYGVRLSTTRELIPELQGEHIRPHFARVLEKFSHWHMVAIDQITRHSGSLMLALLAVEGAITRQQVCDASQMEDIFQLQEWGEDEEKMEALAAQRLAIDGAIDYLSLLNQ